MWQAVLLTPVGETNTALDSAVYSVLTRALVGWERIPADVVFTTIAMTFSFVVKSCWVFSLRRRYVAQARILISTTNRSCAFMRCTAL